MNRLEPLTLGVPLIQPVVIHMQLWIFKQPQWKSGSPRRGGEVNHSRGILDQFADRQISKPERSLADLGKQQSFMLLVTREKYGIGGIHTRTHRDEIHRRDSKLALGQVSYAHARQRGEVVHSPECAVQVE